MDLLISGNIQTILNGQVTPHVLHPVQTAKMPYALGGAAIPHQEPLSIGETIIFDAKGHIFTVDKIYEDAQMLNAAFLMGIERKPHDRIQAVKSQTIDAFYQELLEKYPKGFAIVGDAIFTTLHVAYLKLSPIYGENVNVLHDKYWQTEELKDRTAKLFGIALPSADPMAFYQNPNDKNLTLPSHTHVLAPLARHLLTDSTLKSGTFWVEEIEHCRHF